ncbi:type IV secretory system conjugative DNA transfer family protein [Sphingomonas crocodyli]|uniref:Type IV secretory system conjugative DNA transfer family protein n=1 Tax=Sphingomonas crocodyli TaxID=1979270 RepID=A0A437LY96_9SPHN|nr:type IV secretory system conjugative DNA transfer family protein [Sphingomonas crocodyli]RVT90294.1 type IV secretory system conjugative DNA transfer family protein [Sphingomonas crocodyli]
MTLFGQAAPRAKLALALAGAIVLVLAILAAGALVALFGLGQISPNMRIERVPAFFYHYRADPTVRGWLMRGMMLSGAAAAIGVGMLVRRRASLHGDARFARETELRREGLRSTTGILLGRKSGRYLIFGGSEHVLLEAPTRSGKGVGVVIPNLLNWKDSVVVLDVKKENWDLTAGFRARQGQQVLLFDPLDPGCRTARYNPLGYIDRDNPIEVINELQKVAVMLFPSPERGDPFWIDASRIGFIGIGGVVAATADLPFTIGEIYRQLTNGDPKVRLPRLLRERDEAGAPLSAACASAITDFTSASDNTFASIKQTITSRLNLWLNPYVDDATSESDFDLRDLRRRRLSIYLGVSPDNLDRIAPLYNLFFQQLVDLNTREHAVARAPVEVLVLLDEFARLGRATTIASSIAYIATYGLRLLLVIQSRAQLRALYGPDEAETIVTNCGVEIAFTPKELRVANDLSERLGYYTIKAISKSRTIHGLIANRSQSESDQRRALMLPQELMQMPRGDMLILRGGIPPIRASKILYYQRADFTRRLADAPVLAPRDLKPIPRFVEGKNVSDGVAATRREEEMSPDIMAGDRQLLINADDLNADVVELIETDRIDGDRATQIVCATIAQQLGIVELASGGDDHERN